MTTNFPRIGFHYFPDTAHYRQIDLDSWLPELQRFGAGGVTLLAPPTRAIPEQFIAGLLSAGIEPTLHFPFHCRAKTPVSGVLGGAVTGCIPTPDACPPPETLRLLLNAYARWGVRRVTFFDRPNLRAMWTPSDWLQGDLVERFLDLFLPVATLALEAGLQPVFPPLAPGGDYWDLSFLRSALRGLKRRCTSALLENLTLSAEAFTGERPLEWGAGGPERWTSVRPYSTPDGDQDHIGFRIFEWYLAIARQELGTALPIMLLRMGKRYAGSQVVAAAPDEAPQSFGWPDEDAPNPAPLAGRQLAIGAEHARQNLALAEMLADKPEDGGLPGEVLAGYFWLLSAAPRSQAALESWFPPAGRLLPVVGAFQAWAAHRLGLPPVAPAKPAPASPPANPAPENDTPVSAPNMPPAPPISSDGAAPENAAPAPLQPETGAPVPGLMTDTPAPATQPDQGGPQETSQVEAGGEAGSLEALPQTVSAQPPVESIDQSIDHYILLPLYAWGAADWDLALIQPLIHQGHPTIGFSLTEARLARRVTVVGGPGSVSKEALEMLRKNGCQVERLMEDGTLIASN